MRKINHKFSLKLGCARSVLIGSSLALGCLVSPAVAQDDDAEDRVAVLDTVTVTASKTGETDLLKTAVTATVITGESLETRQVRNAEDLQFQTPGLVVDQSAGVPRVAIRGVGHDGALIHAENGVAVYADDIILQRTQAVTAAFFDLESVDVLKGPQGTAFGRNANGGAVNYVSRRPEEGLTVEGGVGVGSFGREEIYGIYNYGTEDYGLRVGADYKQDDGFATNLATGEDTYGRESLVLKGSFAFAPTENFDGLLRLGYFDEDLNGPATAISGVEPFSVPALFGANISTDPNEEFENFQDLPNRQQSEISNASLHLDWDVGGINLRSITGFYDADFVIQNDADHSDFPLIPVPSNNFASEQFSQEFVISGSNGSLDWVGGLYYLTEDVGQTVILDFFLPFDPAGVTSILADDQTLESNAIFAEGTWSISEDLRLIAGVRYTEDTKEIDFDQTVTTGPLSPAPGVVVPLCQQSFKETWDDVTWNATVEKDLSENTFAYAKVNTGFKAGGFVASNCGESFEPEELTAYEIGYKGTFLGGTLSLASSAFYYDYKNIQLNQVEQVEGTSTTTSATRNAAEATTYGAEIELQALLSDNWSFDLGVSWVPTSEYDEFFNVDALDIRAIDPMLAPPDPLDLSGNRLNRSPEFSGVVGLNYGQDLGSDWGVDARVEYYFTDDIAFSPFERPNTFNAMLFPGLEEDSNIQEGYGLLNTYLTLSKGDAWSLNLYGKNLTDEYYFTGMVESAAVGHILADFGRPREFGARLNVKFGG